MIGTHRGAQLDLAKHVLRDHFLGWQCRIRQFAVRRDAGRPGPGMRPMLYVDDQKIGRITVLINKRDPEKIAAEFRHAYQRTADPADRMEAALRKLAEAYFQRAGEFSDELTALFAIDSTLAEALVAHGTCRLEFEHGRQEFRLPCEVHKLAKDDPAFQVTYWHNSLFNPSMPGEVTVLGFRPQWKHAVADPAPQ